MTSNNSTQTCPICVENYNKRARLPVECQFCHFSACRTCCQTYMMDENVPKCMNTECGKEWTLHFLRESFTQSFINNDLKTHREEVLFQQQIALLPETQSIVEREILREGIREDIRKINLEITKLNNELTTLWNRYHAAGRPDRTGSTPRAEFVRNCPETDCRGFLSSQWKCGICSKWTCPTCHEVKGLDRTVEHTCDPSNVATAELLAQDTRHCPKCTTPIFKIDGCDQMWCTQCQTGFSWRTGQIENNVHNPHYFEWLRRTGGEVPRTPGEFVCGRELTHRTATTIERLIFRKTAVYVEHMADTRYSPDSERIQHPNSKPTYDRVLTIIRAIIHINHVDRMRYNTNPIVENQDLRVSYMRNKLSPERFKLLLQQRNKRSHKHREILNVIDILANATTDILYRFQEYLISSPTTECNANILDEIDVIRDYSNECLSDISYTYGSVLLQFTESLRLVS